MNQVFIKLATKFSSNLFSWIDEQFSANKEVIVISPIPLDTKSKSNQQTYINAVKIIKENLKDNICIAVKKDLEQNNMLLELGAQDWIDIYFEIIKQNLRKEIKFEIAKETVSLLDTKELNNFFHKIISVFSEDAADYTYVAGFYKFVELALSEGAISVETKEQGLSWSGNRFSLDNIIDEVSKVELETKSQYEKGKKSFYPSVKKLNIKLNELRQEYLKQHKIKQTKDTLAPFTK